MRRGPFALLVAIPAATVLVTLGSLLYDIRGATPGRRLLPLTRAVEIEVPILLAATVVYQCLQMRWRPGVAQPRPGSAAERRALGLRVGWIDVAAAAVFLTCSALFVFTLGRDRARLKTQQERIADVNAHEADYSDAVKTFTAYVAAHPHATLAEVQQMNRLSAESIRLGGLQSTRITAMVAAGVAHSPTHNLPLWGLVVLPPLWTAWQSWTRKHRLARRETGRCVQCGYDLRATAGRCPECGAAAADVPHRAPLRSE